MALMNWIEFCMCTLSSLVPCTSSRRPFSFAADFTTLDLSYSAALSLGSPM